MMRRLAFVLIFALSLFAEKLGAQCLIITNPAPVCSPATVDITAAGVTLGSTATSFSYYLDAGGTLTFSNPATATGGTYYIKGDGGIGCSDIKPVTVVVNLTVAAGVTIEASANPVCTGTSVTFTATPTNGGASPSYQWKVNGINAGTNSATYSYIPLNNDAVTCVLTSNATCTTGSPATSSPITMTVNPNLPASVSIAAVPSGPVCTGTSVTFTATPTNGGASPSYQWKVNGINAGTNSATYSYIPLNNDAVTCVLTSNATCTTGSPATSSPITMTVNPNLPASVSIAAVPSGPVCTGTSVTFTATPTNGGASPSYQWKVNGINAGTNSATYSYIPLNNDAVTCVLTSNATCTTGSPATSSPITMTVNPNLPASVSIAAVPSGPVCTGTSVTFTATPTNGGASPSYQWKVNGINAGTNSATYSYIPLNNDAVTCVLTSNATCTTGSPATILSDYNDC